MKRRKALKHIGVGVTAGFALPWLSSCDDKAIAPEINYGGVVGIVGAGAAGLFAADYLMSKGIKVKIFEASNRIGGRIRSVKISDLIFANLIADFPVELGAERVFGSDSEFGKLIKLLKVPTVDFRGVDGNAVDKCILDNQYKKWSEVEGDSDIASLINFKNNVLPTYSGNDSLQAAAGLNGRANKILNSYLANPYGSSADRISAKALGEAISLTEHDGKELTLNINSMSDVILSRFSKAAGKVMLNRAIESIDYSGEKVSLTVKDTVGGGTTTDVVDKLILTVPVSILKDGDINFTPSLPNEKISAMSKIGMDASIRIILEFTRNDNIGADTAFIHGFEEAPSAFLAGAGRSGSNGNRTFSFTINGPKAEELSAKSDIEKIEQILSEWDGVKKDDLVTPALYGTRDVRRVGEIGQEEIVYVVKEWTPEAEPYIKGGQSYPLVGGTNADRVSLAEPVGENLFFAGEATDTTGEFGTVSGALKSGKRAAEEVIAAITGATI